MNYHSGLCLTASPDDGTAVYMQTCGTNHVQYWDAVLLTGYGVYGDYLIENVHESGYCVTWSNDLAFISDCGANGDLNGFALVNV